MGTRRVAAIVLLGLALAAPGSGNDWQATFGLVTDGEDLGVATKTDDSGNIYVLATCVNSSQNSDVVVLKYPPSGGTPGVWAFDSQFEDSAVAFVLDEHTTGSVWIYVAASANDNVYTLKFDGTDPGTRQNPTPPVWSQMFDAGGYDRPVDIALHWQADSGYGVVVAGITQAMGVAWHGLNYLVLCYCRGGTRRWWRSHDATGVQRDSANDYAAAVACDSLYSQAWGRVYVTGKANRSAVCDWEYFTVCFEGDAPGVPKWSDFENKGGEQEDAAVDLAVYGSYYLFVTGRYFREREFENYSVQTIRLMKYWEGGSSPNPRESGFFAEAAYGDDEHCEVPVELAVNETGVYIAVQRLDEDDNVYMTRLRYNLYLDEQYAMHRWIGDDEGLQKVAGVASDANGTASFAATALGADEQDVLVGLYGPNGAQRSAWRYNGTEDGADMAADVAVYNVANDDSFVVAVGST
ncbi:MAG: hypothetical protein ABIK86_07950 [candidate division WOR-3 bacterium]